MGSLHSSLNLRAVTNTVNLWGSFVIRDCLGRADLIHSYSALLYFSLTRTRMRLNPSLARPTKEVNTKVSLACKI